MILCAFSLKKAKSEIPSNTKSSKHRHPYSQALVPSVNRSQCPHPGRHHRRRNNEQFTICAMKVAQTQVDEDDATSDSVSERDNCASNSMRIVNSEENLRLQWPKVQKGIEIRPRDASNKKSQYRDPLSVSVMIPK
jgi:hypothetical protein